MDAPPHLLFVSSGARETREGFEERFTGHATYDFADLYEADFGDLAAYDAVLVGMHVDQRRLTLHSASLSRYAAQGGTILVNGHIAYPILPGLSAFQNLGGYRLEDLKLHRPHAHPIFDGVLLEDLGSRRGVAGFYARGWHKPPEGAQIIHTIGDAGHPVDFCYSIGAGRVFFHGGNDLWGFGSAEGSTWHLVPQMLTWIRKDRCS
jgi:hypothetical protein